MRSTHICWEGGRTFEGYVESGQGPNFFAAETSACSSSLAAIGYGIEQLDCVEVVDVIAVVGTSPRLYDGGSKETKRNTEAVNTTEKMGADQRRTETKPGDGDQVGILP